MSHAASVQEGELIAGKYRVDRVLGEGGMGIVVAATNEALRQKVAIKLLREGALANAEALGRFKREAQAAASLRSNHVARVLDVGSLPDGRPMMVMEMLEGIDLGDLVDQNGALPIPAAVDYVLQACEAIAEAHAAGIIHRDLKPKNLFLTRTVDGRPLVKVLDFGISKVMENAATSFSGMELTKTAEVIGSPSYMSPEQLRSARYVDARTDIWALGVILYELISGHLPFNAETVTQLVLVVAMEQERPVHLLRSEVPQGLSQVIAQCLAKSPDQRFQTVGELARCLAPFAQTFETSAAERVRAVEAGSGKSLPMPSPSSSSSSAGVTGPSSSARIEIAGVHASTSVAWGQTLADTPRGAMSGAPQPQAPAAPPPRASNGVLVAGIVLGALVLLGGAIGGTIFLMRMKGASTHAGAQPTAAESVPLPPGRKDLPPLDSARPPPPATAIATPETSAVPSALPSARTSPPPKASGAAKPKPPPPTNPDDLSNIGRR